MHRDALDLETQHELWEVLLFHKPREDVLEEPALVVAHLSHILEQDVHRSVVALDYSNMERGFSSQLTVLLLSQAG